MSDPRQGDLLKDPPFPPADEYYEGALWEKDDDWYYEDDDYEDNWANGARYA